MRLRLLPLLALLGPALPAAAQSHTAYFDDFTYRAAGAPVDAPAADAFFGASRWLTGADGSTEVMRSWRLGGDDATFTGPPAAYWHGPATVSFVGQGAERALRLTLEAGYPHGDGVLVPTLSSGQAFAPTGTFAARVRLSALEAGQRMIEAFWIDSADEFRFCPPAEPACDARTGTAGTLGYWSEADFEFNNWFLHELGPSVSVGTGAYRHYGGDFEGGRSGPLDCRQGLGRVLRPLCRDGAGRSLFADRWVLLIYQLDPGRVVREGADAYAGAISFIARSDEPGRPGAFEAVPRADAREGIPGLEGVPAVWRSVGQAAEANSDYEARPISLYPRDGLSIRISLHYDGRTGEVACPRDAEGREVTCRPHTMEVDWVYHSPDVLSPEEVVAEVEGWRARRAGRVNTLRLRPYDPTPPLASPGSDPAQLQLVLQGPAQTAGPATWSVGPASPRGIVYGMDVEVETRCAASAPRCRARTLRPRAPFFTVAPAPGETGMTVRAKLTDPWWGYTHVPTPGSAWREWEVRFTR